MPTDHQKESIAAKKLFSFFNKKKKKEYKNYNDLVSNFNKKLKSK